MKENKILNTILVFVFIMIGCKNPMKVEENLIYEKVDSEVSSETSKSRGILICKNAKIDYGKIRQGDKFVQKFQFINEGKEVVELLGYEKSCNCTEVEIEKHQIYPQDSLNVQMIIDTKDKLLGNHKSTLTLKTNGIRKFYLLTTNYEIIK